MSDAESNGEEDQKTMVDDIEIIRTSTTHTSKPSSISRSTYNTRFKQQKMIHLRLAINSTIFGPLCLVIAMLLLPAGIGICYSSFRVEEKVLDYTNCVKSSSEDGDCGIITSTSILQASELKLKCCTLNFTLENPLKGKVIVYYALSNFYQNHRRYVKSRDNKQLFGETDEPSKDCRPYDIDRHHLNKFYWPCGAIANSMFQDEISIYSYRTQTFVELHQKDIAWKSDLNYRFKNPPNWNTSQFQKTHAKPKAWRMGAWDLEDGLRNEHFVVWMRVAALPNFRKTYGSVVNENGEDRDFENGLSEGNYRLHVKSDFRVNSFKGRKSVVIATKALLGGRNILLGIGYLVVGFICLLEGLFFLCLHFNSMKVIA